MNLNEPVAWMKTYRGRPHEIAFNKNDLSPAKLWNSFEPLYIHPVKKLTDEEVEDCFPENGCSSTEDGFGLVVSAQFLHDFARAILRKASEK